MTARRPGADAARSVEAEVNREVAAIRRQHADRPLSQRCRVCQDPESRARVNRLLAHGFKAPEIEGLVADLNERRAKNGKITYWSILRHAENHFNVQEPVAASRRRILERRRAEAAAEMGDAAAHLLTGMAYLDIVAQKGFETLLAEDTVVDYETGLKAQLKLEDMQRDGAMEQQVAEMRRDVSLIQQAVKDVVSPAVMSEIIARIDELKGTTRDRFVDAEVVDDEDEDDDVGHDPVLSVDANDALGED